jgi:hypothetical protein
MGSCFVWSYLQIQLWVAIYAHGPSVLICWSLRQIRKYSSIVKHQNHFSRVPSIKIWYEFVNFSWRDISHQVAHLTRSLRYETLPDIFNQKGWVKVPVCKLDVRGSLHHSIIHMQKIQQDAAVYQILFHIYIKLNMFRATYRPSSGAQNCTSSIWFCIRGGLLAV